MLPEEYPVEQLDKYAHAYRTQNKERAKVTCLSYPALLDQKLSREETREVLIARFALFACNFLAGIIEPDHPNAAMYIPSAEHFTMRYVPLLKGVKKGTFRAEFPRLHVMGSVSDKAISNQPEHLHTCFHAFFNPLRRAIDLLLKKPDDRIAPYVWRSLEWFFHAHSSQEHLTEEVRVVLLCMAIEAALCEVSKRDDFARKVSTAVSVLRLPKYYYCERNGKQIRGSILEKWASEFYLLRNSLVHAKAKKDTPVVWRGGRRRFMHCYLASYVWFECLWHTMGQAGVIPRPPKDTRPATLHSTIKYGKWFWAWKSELDGLRERWRELLTGRGIQD
jgi:hypothetical protein